MTQVASSRPSTLVGGVEACSFIAFSISSTIVRTCLVFVALVITNASVMEMMSPTSRAMMSSPFLADAAAAATATRRSTTGAPVKQQPRRSSSMTIVEAAFGDGTHHRRRDQPVDGVALSQPRPEVPRRDVEARDRDALDPPPRCGRFGVCVPGSLDDDEGGQLSGLLQLPPRRHVAGRVGTEHWEELA